MVVWLVVSTVTTQQKVSGTNLMASSCVEFVCSFQVCVGFICVPMHIR